MNALSELSYDEKVALVRQRFKSAADLHRYLTEMRKYLTYQLRLTYAYSVITPKPQNPKFIKMIYCIYFVYIKSTRAIIFSTCATF